MVVDLLTSRWLVVWGGGDSVRTGDGDQLKVGRDGLWPGSTFWSKFGGPGCCCLGERGNGRFVDTRWLAGSDEGPGDGEGSILAESLV